ncbi:hypothetical protein HD554DRAFT_2018135 [Boletus coccyginus]|nr:hypothetical protein HD554DRAFT_2018135 [Boletus coccyginus]
MSSSGSSDLETGITQQIKSKRPKKKTKHTAVAATPTDDAKNEGDDPHWDYEPPEGAVLLDHTVDAGPFEWDALHGDHDDTEIWFIRAPAEVKAKHLKGLEINPPSSSSRTARIGGLTTKNASYDAWSIGDDDAEDVGGEELRGLSCLLPRKSKQGKLYIAPECASRHIVISPHPSVPKAPSPRDFQKRPRPSYPKDVYKHSFVPYGARSGQARSEALSMDVDDIESTRDEPAPPPTDKPAKTKESKGKKRKVEGDSHKKSKKHKTNA